MDGILVLDMLILHFVIVCHHAHRGGLVPRSSGASSTKKT